MDSVDLTQNAENLLLALALAILRFGHESSFLASILAEYSHSFWNIHPDQGQHSLLL
jgi:hypothetical protein